MADKAEERSERLTGHIAVLMLLSSARCSLQLVKLVLSELITPAYAPFIFALFLMLGVGVIEALGTGFGHLDADADTGLDGSHSVLLNWLGAGSGLPFLVWLTSFLSCFSVIGIAVQQVSTSALGSPLPVVAASGAAFALALVANKFVAAGLARIFPGFESSVISTDDLIMRRGTVLEGSARRGHPARAKVVDQHRQAHFIMIEPVYDSDVIDAGQTALLVRKDGIVFYALPDVDTALSPLS